MLSGTFSALSGTFIQRPAAVSAGLVHDQHAHAAARWHGLDGVDRRRQPVALLGAALAARHAAKLRRGSFASTRVVP